MKRPSGVLDKLARIEGNARWAKDHVFADGVLDAYLLLSAFSESIDSDVEISSLITFWRTLATGAVDRVLNPAFWDAYSARRAAIQAADVIARAAVAELRANGELRGEPQYDDAEDLRRNAPGGELTDSDAGPPHLPRDWQPDEAEMQREYESIVDMPTPMRFGPVMLPRERDALLSRLDRTRKVRESRVGAVDVHTFAQFNEPTWGRELTTDQRALVIDETLRRCERDPRLDLPGSFAWRRLRAVCLQAANAGAAWVLSNSAQSPHARVLGYSLLGEFRCRVPASQSRLRLRRTDDAEARIIVETEEALANVLVCEMSGVAHASIIFRGFLAVDDARKVISSLLAPVLEDLLEPVES